MKRAIVNRNNYQLLTCDMGQLVPIGLQEVLPGETIRHSSSVLIRLSPMAAPVMHPVQARVHHFFINNRILWKQDIGGTPGDNWEDFITGGDDGLNAATPPQVTSTATPNSLLDYLGIPHVPGLSLNAMPVIAFNMTYNEWFRDQDLVPERDLLDLTIPQVAWEKDYFTMARPFQQKGPEVSLPVGGLAPVKGIGMDTPTWGSTPVNVYESDGTTPTYAGNKKISDEVFPDNIAYVEEGTNGYPNIFADLAQATGASITDVRKAFAIQRYQENRARYGSRYVEYLKRSFGARPQDGRLQRPELLGAGVGPVNVSEILQTAPDSTGDPRFGVGDLYGHGIAALRSNGYKRTIPEHGYILSLLSVRPKSIYVDGVDRHWLKSTKFDYFQPELKLVGQQEMLKNEIYADAAAGMETFGWQDRYSEYRHAKSNVHAEFRTLLNYWHMGREFESPPVLNQSFTDCVPTKRIFNEQTQHSLWIMVNHRMKAISPIGRNAEPRVI